MRRVYVTLDALTEGIRSYVFSEEVRYPGMSPKVPQGTFYAEFNYPQNNHYIQLSGAVPRFVPLCDFFFTLEEAEARVQWIRETKVRSLSQWLAKLQDPENIARSMKLTEVESKC